MTTAITTTATTTRITSMKMSTVNIKENQLEQPAKCMVDVDDDNDK